MATIEVPAGVGVASLGVVDNARVVLRSDGEVMCSYCQLSATIALVEAANMLPNDEFAGQSHVCSHIDQVARLGRFVMRRDADQRIYPTFVWHRRNGATTEARWSVPGDVDGAIAALIEAVTAAIEDQGLGIRRQEARLVATRALALFTRAGYVVAPEWAWQARKGQPIDAGTGRGARVIDFDEDES